MSKIEPLNCRIEPLQQSHLLALETIALRGDLDASYTIIPSTPSAFRAYAADALALAYAGRAHVYAILQHQRVVGTTRLVLESWSSNPAHTAPAFMLQQFQAGEIGWTWLAPEVRGTGVNEVAKLRLLTQAFEELKLLRVCLKTDARNLRSRAAIEKLGAHADGVLRAHMCAADNHVRDSAFYSIVADEWPSTKAMLEKRIAEAEEAADAAPRTSRMY